MRLNEKGRSERACGAEEADPCPYKQTLHTNCKPISPDSHPRNPERRAGQDGQRAACTADGGRYWSSAWMHGNDLFGFRLNARGRIKSEYRSNRLERA